MIVFDLACQSAGHRFEGWFASSEDFADQQARGLLCCPNCGDPAVAKAPMAPAVPRKGNSLPAETRPMRNVPMPPEAARMMEALARIQSEALKDSRWVGGSFAEETRAMHYGERATETIHGQATLAEAKELVEEGIPVSPLPFPVTPTDEAN